MTNKFKTAFGEVIMSHKEFAYQIADSGLELAAVKRSIIVPSKSELTKIKKIKDKREKLMELMHYIINEPKASPQKLKSLTKVRPLLKNSYYLVTVKGSKLKLNDIDLTLIKEFTYSSLYSVKKRLVPTETNAKPETKKLITKKSTSKKKSVTKKSTSKKKTAGKSKSKRKKKTSKRSTLTVENLIKSIVI